MNKRDALFVGFTLLGAYILVQVVLQVSTVAHLVADFLNFESSQAISNYAFSSLCVLLLETGAGVFLILKSSRFANALVRRDARLSGSSTSQAPPAMPSAEC